MKLTDKISMGLKFVRFALFLKKWENTLSVLMMSVMASAMLSDIRFIFKFIAIVIFVFEGYQIVAREEKKNER